MKIIHCADIHLDSKMSSHFTKEQSAKRRQEILATFLNMIDYARKHAVDAILIAGDLYDTSNISARVKDIVVQTIKDCKNIDFYYLKGNHDAGTVLSAFDTVPENLHLFEEEEWTCHRLKASDVCISGIELTKHNNARAFPTLKLDSKQVNIVMLHGQLVEYSLVNSGQSFGDTGIISLKDLQNKGIDYLALGHIHKREQKKLDERGTYAYSGCLEGRGFDECGVHGFYLLEIDETGHRIKTNFITIAKRILHEIEVDISGCRNTMEIRTAITTRLRAESVKKDDMVRVRLTGSVSILTEIDEEFLETQFSTQYYVFQVKNEVKLQVDYSLYKKDISLKGEFVRMVEADESLSEDEKSAIIRHGLKLLMGEIKYVD